MYIMAVSFISGGDRNTPVVKVEIVFSQNLLKLDFNTGISNGRAENNPREHLLSCVLPFMLFFILVISVHFPNLGNM
jgi:hypothetical protein